MNAHSSSFYDDVSDHVPDRGDGARGGGRGCGWWSASGCVSISISWISGVCTFHIVLLEMTVSVAADHHIDLDRKPASLCGGAWSALIYDISSDLSWTEQLWFLRF